MASLPDLSQMLDTYLPVTESITPPTTPGWGNPPSWDKGIQTVTFAVPAREDVEFFDLYWETVKVLADVYTKALTEQYFISECYYILYKANIGSQLNKAKLIASILFTPPKQTSAAGIFCQCIYRALGRKIDILIRGRLIRQKCAGCSQNSIDIEPSQESHNLCLLSRQEQLEYLLDDAIKEISDSDIALVILEELQNSDLRSRVPYVHIAFCLADKYLTRLA